MGLQSQLNDVSSDSIPLLLLSLLAACFSYLRSSLSSILHSLGLSPSPQPLDFDDDSVLTSLDSGLAGLIALADQLNLNRALASRFSAGAASDQQYRCIVCLCDLKDGDHVRRLPCRHVFHKGCFDGWLDSRNFSCPLCRAPLPSAEHVDCTAQRVGAALVPRFSRRGGALDA